MKERHHRRQRVTNRRKATKRRVKHAIKRQIQTLCMCDDCRLSTNEMKTEVLANKSIQIKLQSIRNCIHFISFSVAIEIHRTKTVYWHLKVCASAKFVLVINRHQMKRKSRRERIMKLMRTHSRVNSVCRS